MMLSDLIFWGVYAFLIYCAVFLFFTLVSKARRVELRRWEEWPSVTVVIPAYNEEKTIAKTIESVLGLDYPKDKLKVIVVNDGSTDRTLEIARRYERDGVLVLSQENKGKAAALNHGLRYVDSEFFACLDADSLVRKDTLKKMMRYFTSDKVSAVCPLMKVNNPKNLLQKLQWLEYILYAFLKKIFAAMNAVHVTPGPFSIYRTSIVKKLGGFDESSIVEDQEIAWRMQRHHYIIRQSMDGEVLTNAPKTLKGLYKQRRRWYVGSLQTIWKYRDMIFNKRYGDFGMFQAPTLLIGSAILPFVTVLITLRYIVHPVIRAVWKWYHVGFNVLPSLQSWWSKTKAVSLLLAYDYGKIFIIVILLIINMYWMYRAYREAGERLEIYFIPALALFFIAYYILLSFIWVASMISMVKKRRRWW